jgi:hypothetical protein
MRSARAREVRQAYARPLKEVGLRRSILSLERLESYGDLMSQVEAVRGF